MIDFAPGVTLDFRAVALRNRTAVPELARWIPDAEPGKITVQRALLDIFLMESPPGSNRGSTIDSYNRACGVAVGSPYCASSLAAWWRDTGLAIPPMPGDPFWAAHRLPAAYGPASTDAWREWALITSRWTDTPVLGGAIVYGRHNNPEHIALVIRLSPLLMTEEANTTADGRYNREGVIFDRRVVDLKTNDRVLGFIDRLPPDFHPSPLP